MRNEIMEIYVATPLPFQAHKHTYPPLTLHTCTPLTHFYLLRFLGQTKVAMMMLIITSSFTSPAVQKSLGEFPFSAHTHTQALT